MKKFVSLFLCFMVLLCIFSINSPSVLAQTPNPESDFVAEKGVIKQYVGKSSDVIIPSTIDGYKVIEIDTEAFFECNYLTSVVIPEGVKKIWHRAFKYCSNLKTVVLPYSLEQMGTEVFHSADVRSVTIPPNLKKVPYGAFSNCRNLTDIKFSYGVEEIHVLAFFGTRPSRVVFPETVKMICGASFNYLNTRGPIEFVICNPDCEFGTYIKGGLWGDYMEGKFKGDIFRPVNSTLYYRGEKGIKIIVPQNSYVGVFIEENHHILLNASDDPGSIDNTYIVDYYPLPYFKYLDENKTGFGTQNPETEKQQSTTQTETPKQNNTPASTNKTPSTSQSSTQTSSSSTSSTTTNKPTAPTTPPVVEVTEDKTIEEPKPEDTQEEQTPAENPSITVEPMNLTPVTTALYVIAGIVVLIIAAILIIFRKDIFKKTK